MKLFRIKRRSFSRQGMFPRIFATKSFGLGRTIGALLSTSNIFSFRRSAFRRDAFADESRSYRLYNYQDDVPGYFFKATRQVSPGVTSISMPTFLANSFHKGMHHL